MVTKQCRAKEKFSSSNKKEHKSDNKNITNPNQA